METQEAACYEECPLCGNLFSAVEIGDHVQLHFDADEFGTNGGEGTSAGRGSNPDQIDEVGGDDLMVENLVACSICGEFVALHRLDDHERRHTSHSQVNSSSSKRVASPTDTKAQNSQRAPKRRTGACFLCGEDGHWRSECPQRYKKALMNFQRLPTEFGALKEFQCADERFESDNDIIPLIRDAIQLQRGNRRCLLSGPVQHFCGQPSDAGWGCGWRNAQMLSSHLMRNPQAKEVLYGGAGFVPNIWCLQAWLELAWKEGFDKTGCLQLGGSIQGSDRWIGTLEVVSMLRQFGICAHYVDFVGSNSPLHACPTGGTYHSSVACDGCKMTPIVGRRHQSLAIPDFDLCDHCVRTDFGRAAEPFSTSGHPPTHKDVKCGICGEIPITGVRYKHKKIPDFDLCSDCYDGQEEREKEYFTIIRTPENAGRGGNKKNGGGGGGGAVSNHRNLIDWVWSYFSKGIEDLDNGVVMTGRAPLYFQHQGHSRTIAGIERTRQNGGTSYNLIVLDPGIPAGKLRNALREKRNWAQLLKRGPHTLRHPEYQLIHVEGGLVSREDLTGMKVMKPSEHIRS